jgi:CHAT domain-containing protein
VILPDVDFDRVPWYALPGKKADSNLIDDYAICTALNGEHLIELLPHANESSDDRVPCDDSESNSLKGSLFISDIKYGSERWKPLLASGREVRDVMGLPSALKPNTWLHHAGAYPQKVATELSRHRHVHISTHALFSTEEFETAFKPLLLKDRKENVPFDPDALFQSKLQELALRRAGQEPQGKPGDIAAEVALEESPLSCSVLALSKSEEATGVWQGSDVLSAEVISSLDLRCVDLLVLSACNTNRGPAVVGEGTLSLQRAFLLAGADTVIGSLWDVDEQATSELMTQFYKNYWERHLTKVEALRCAQLLMRDRYNNGIDGVSRESKPLPPGLRTPPRLWAQFMLCGDWGR